MNEPCKMKTRFCSPLVKIFQKRSDFKSEPFKSFSALRGEHAAFQLAVCPEGTLNDCTIKPVSKLKNIRIRIVESVPVRYLPANLDDDAVIREPGLVPDLLAELPERDFTLPGGIWRAFHISVSIPKRCRAGIYEIAFEISAKDKKAFRTKPFKLEIIPAELPEQELIRTEWFHCDSLAEYYDVPVFSEEHWYLIETFMRNACSHGCNMILTPVFTPPLDTEIGKERPTVQLVDVCVTKNGYEFGFDRLARWIELAQSAGMKHFEISHLFTQWGAKAVPKIIADVNGEKKRIFGWDTASSSKKYTDFLKQFLPQLCGFLKATGLSKEQIWFHTSDEPSEEHIREYSKAAKLLKKLTPGFRHLDALSHYEFYQNGLVETPVPGIGKTDEFLEKGMKDAWTYYCCCPETGYTSRFIHASLPRTRILGIQLYSMKIRGFLHWGFNFYFSRLSKSLIDPFQTNHANYAFPPGDSFLVYPGEDGEPFDSIRHEALFEGIQDMRALTLLEKKIGRKKVLVLIHRFMGKDFSFNRFPTTEKNLLALRDAVNNSLKNA